MNKPSKCKNCQWYGKPYWSVINPCDNCDREDYYKVMESYYTEDYVKSLLQQIQELTNNWNELRQHIKEYLKEWENSDDERVKGKCDMARDILYDMEDKKEIFDEARFTKDN